MKIYLEILIVAVAIYFLASFCLAKEEIELERIVVTPTRYSEEMENIPAAITVIERKDIEESNAKNALDILAKETGLLVKDYYGTGAKAFVDLRGFGETGGSNVLVLVDGRRVNEIDLSGVAWTQIPLDQIERIEIMRGSGSVLYGDNAVGGVINIITKKGKGKPTVEFKTLAGSYAMNEERFSLMGSQDKLSYSFNVSQYSINGYRENSYFNTKDFGARIVYDSDTDLSLEMSAGYHDADFGFPGALSEVHLQSRSRKDTRFPDDDAGERDYYLRLGTNKKFSNFGEIDMDISFRRRNQDSSFLSSSAGFNPIFLNRIDTIGITPRYILDRDFFGRKNRFILGIDLYSSDYMSDNYNESDALQNFTDIDKDSAGYYFQDRFSISKRLVAVGGYRYEKVRYQFDYHDNTGVLADIDSSLTPKKKAANLGLIYKYLECSELFLNLSKSFRLPATDEYFSVWATPPVNINLRPQTGKHYELGVRHHFAKDLEGNLTLFRMDLKDELFYNPATFSNENYDKTRHGGAEFELKSRINEYLNIFGNISYIKSKFVGGTYDNNDIPAVPRYKGSLGFGLDLPKNLKINLIGNYVGKQYFISDQANTLPKMDEYVTVDTNISREFKDLNAFFTINNIFNERYSEYGVKSGSLRFYYPSPERNFVAGISYKF